LEGRFVFNLNSVGDRTEPCGDPFHCFLQALTWSPIWTLNWRFEVTVYSGTVNAFKNSLDRIRTTRIGFFKDLPVQQGSWPRQRWSSVQMRPHLVSYLVSYHVNHRSGKNFTWWSWPQHIVSYDAVKSRKTATVTGSRVGIGLRHVIYHRHGYGQGDTGSHIYTR